jgi:hypothetical protein
MTRLRAPLPGSICSVAIHRAKRRLSQTQLLPPAYPSSEANLVVQLGSTGNELRLKFDRRTGQG